MKSAKFFVASFALHLYIFMHLLIFINKCIVMFVKVFILLFGWEISSLTVAVCVYMEFQGDHRVQLNFYWKVSSCPCDSKASARLPLKCEHVNLKAGAVEKVNRKSDREWKRENWGVYYFCPVFSFTVPSPSVERGPFLPLTIGVSGATHKLCEWMCTVLSTHSSKHTLIWMTAKVIALTYTLSPSLITLFCLGCVYFL